MHCDACVRRLNLTLQKLPGVRIESVQVGSARLSYNPAQTKPDQILAAIARTGFTARAA